MTHWRLLPQELAALSFEDYCRMVDALDTVEREAGQETRLNAAFTAWLLGAGGRKTWGKFCEHYGLIDKPPAMSAEEKKKEAAKARAIAERVIAKDKG